MTSTLDVDAAVVRETLDSLDDDAVVVAHSWGGSPVTLGASGAPNVRHLIYLAAFMIEAGKPAPVDFRTLPPMPAFDLGPEVCVVVPEYAYDAFYHDVDPQVAGSARRSCGRSPAWAGTSSRPRSPGLEPLPDDLRRHRAGPRRQPRRSAGHGSEGRRRRGAGHEPLAVPLPASAGRRHHRRARQAVFRLTTGLNERES